MLGMKKSNLDLPDFYLVTLRRKPWSARQKLEETDLENILLHTSKQLLQREMNHVLENRQVIVVDGTGVSMPNTAKKQQVWPQNRQQKPGCGFPQAFICAYFIMHPVQNFLVFVSQNFLSLAFYLFLKLTQRRAQSQRQSIMPRIPPQNHFVYYVKKSCCYLIFPYRLNYAFI